MSIKTKMQSLIAAANAETGKGDTDLTTAVQSLISESGGTSDHRQLTNRDAANQHPITAITGLQTALDGKANAADIPSAVTESTISGWGFTKNTGTYSKPTGGIPKADLANDVQASLGKADTALQEHQSLAAYRTAAAQNIIDSGKQDRLIAGDNITIADDGKTISATGGAEALIVTITDNNGTLSADKTFIEIRNAILAGITVLVSYGGMILPLIVIADALYFGTFQCANADASNSAIVATVMIEITQNGEVNDTSAQIDIPSAVTDDHINSLIDTKLGVIENGSY